MLPRKFDTTFALKAIGLTDQLSGTEKRVAVTLLDHYNRKTGRCDPSQQTIATLLSVDRRTVNRAIKRFVKIGFFRRSRHKGNNHCNSYQPCWDRFRALEENWKLARRKHANRFGGEKMSLSERQDCPSTDGDAISQTFSNNSIPLTSSHATDPAARPDESAVMQFEELPDLGIFAVRLEKRLGKASFQSWFRSVRLVEASDETIVLSAETKFFASRIEQQFETQVLDCFRPEYPAVIRLRVLVRDSTG
jgi:hypothetical protein